MTYEEALKLDSCRPVTLARWTLPRCLNTFGQGVCTATGIPCYYGFLTCKDPVNFNKGTRTFEYTSVETGVPGHRPYVVDVRYLPTEIKDNLTVSGRAYVAFRDEPDTDVGLDPHLSERASQPTSEHFKKLIARTPNYRGTSVEVLEGFLEIPISEYRAKFAGGADNVTFDGDRVTLEVYDLVQGLADGEKEVARKIDCKLVADINGTETTITLSDVSDIPVPTGGETLYLDADDEIIGYTAVNGTTNEISGGPRGALGTAAATHSANASVGLVRYYPPGDPFDILKDELLIKDAGYASANIDAAAFAEYKANPEEEVPWSAIITKPTKVRKLYFEIVDLLDCKSWMGEDAKITIVRNYPNYPGRTYSEISDEANIVGGSVKPDTNEKSRYTQAQLFWDLDVLGDPDDVDSYKRWSISPDLDAESANFYGDVKPLKLLCRWLRQGLAGEDEMVRYTRNLAMRQTWRHRDAELLISLAVSLKDSDVKTGSWVKLTTRHAVNPDGSTLAREKFQVVYKRRKGNDIELKLIRLHQRRVAFIAPDDTPDYGSATEADKEYGFIWADDLLSPEERREYCIY